MKHFYTNSYTQKIRTVKWTHNDNCFFFTKFVGYKLDNMRLIINIMRATTFRKVWSDGPPYGGCIHLKVGTKFERSWFKIIIFVQTFLLFEKTETPTSLNCLFLSFICLMEQFLFFIFMKNGLVHLPVFNYMWFLNRFSNNVIQKKTQIINNIYRLVDSSA